jgi:hypothetical protein
MLALMGASLFLNTPPPLGATAPIWALAYLHETPFHFSLLDLRHLVGLLGRVISSSQGLPVHKDRKTHIHTQILNIRALSEIGTHDPGFRASEDSACLRPLGYRDRQQSVRV